MRARGRLVGLVAAAGALVLGGALAGRALADAEGPVLHEYVAPPKGAGGGAAAGDAPKAPKTIGGDPQAGKNPVAVRSNDKLLPEPKADDKRKSGEPVHGTNDFGADRQTQTAPDNQTGADGTLHYVEVFNPAIVPFKRMSVLDTVRDGYVLHVFDPRPVPVPVGGKAQPDRDLFWGNLIVQLEAGEDVPIPSTAPDMRILSYEVDPPVDLIFSKDSADNYYVRTDDRRVRGSNHRLVFLSDAPATYFAAQVPPGYKLSDATASGLARPLPPAVRLAAGKVVTRLGIRPDAALDVAVGRLVEYFRGFEAGALPQASSDIYLDLALSKIGVCRHRSFAFVVTALSLGIPARYVTNEAHAFAEVWVPERGWLRVDLGGAALNLDVTNAGDKQMYRPRADDPFPKPPEYSDNYTQLRGDVRGLTPGQIADARRDPNAPGSGADLGQRPPGSTDPIAPTPGQGLPAPPPAMYVGKTPSRVRVDEAEGAGFRGESVRVVGRVESEDGAPLGGVPVNLYLAPAGYGGDGARLLGETYTDGDGKFEVRLDLPRDLSLGKHEVFASTPGDATHQPALSK